MTKKQKIYDRVGFDEGAMIIQEGSRESQAFLIQAGDVEVFRTVNGKEHVLAELGPGEIIGEMALIFDGVRKASVRATSQCSLIRISRPDFEERIENADTAVRAVFQMMVKRISDLNDRVSADISGEDDVSGTPDAGDILKAVQNVKQTIADRPDKVDVEALLGDLEALEELVTNHIGA